MQPPRDRLVHVHLLTVIALWTNLGSAAVPAGDPLRVQVHRFVLENGIDVWVHEDHRAPLISTAVRVNLGTSDEMGGLTAAPGMAHLVEHLMFSGTPGAPDGAHDRWVEAAGGQTNAWTDPDVMVYTTVAPATALELVLALEAERLAAFADAVSDDAVIIQRSVVSEERAELASVVGGMEMAAWQAAVFPPAHPYHWPVLGTVAELELVDAEAVRAFVRCRLVPTRTRIVVAGDVDPEEVERQARHWLGMLPGIEAVPRAAAPAVVWKEEVRWLRTDPDAQLTVLWPTVARGHGDAPALELAARWLAQEGEGCLWRQLVPTDVGVQQVRAWQWNGRLAGYLGIAAHAGDADLTQTLSRMDTCIEELHQTPPDSAALRDLVTQWRAKWVRHLEDPVNRAEVLAQCADGVPAGDCLYMDSLALAAVTPADVVRVVKRWLMGPGRVVVSTVPLQELHRALDDSSPLVAP